MQAALTASPFARDFAALVIHEARVIALVASLRDSGGRTDRECLLLLFTGARKIRVAARRHLSNAVGLAGAEYRREWDRADRLFGVARVLDDAATEILEGQDR